MDKIPPQNIEVENSILGAIISESDLIYKVIPILKPSFFYRESNGFIYAAMLELTELNVPIDLLTLAERLKDLGKLEAIGGNYALAKLSSEVTIYAGANIETHAKIVAEKHYQRSIIRLGTDLEKKGFELTTDELLEFVNTETNNITTECFDINESESFNSLMDRSIEEIEKRQKIANTNEYTGIKTPIFQLTKALNGWQKGDLYVLAGRPGMGKTAFVLATLREAARVGHKPLIFSLEMARLRLIDRILAGESGVSLSKIKSGFLTHEDKKAIKETKDRIRQYGIKIDDKAGINLAYIKSKANILKRKGQCDMIIIDYLQLIQVSEQRNMNLEIGKITSQLKTLARVLDIPIILLSQLNKKIKERADKRPILADLRDSGSIEQDADAVMFLFRPEYYNFTTLSNGNDSKNACELIIAKFREGETQIIIFAKNEDLTNIYDYDPTFTSKTDNCPFN